MIDKLQVAKVMKNKHRGVSLGVYGISLGVYFS